MSLWKKYHLARSIEDALVALEQAEEPSRVIAGGTDLLLDIQQGRHAPVHTLVDVTQIPELNLIEMRQGELFIGAAVPLNHVIASPLVAEHAHALWEAARLIGGPQVRNTATLGGNVAHALPAGDGTIALLCLDAHAEIANRVGVRRQPIESLFLGPGKSALHPRRDLLIGFYISARHVGEASVFQRLMRPQGIAIAILNMGVWLKRQGDCVQGVRISLGPAGTTPKRARQTEAVLLSHPLTSSVVQQASATLLSETSFRTSPHRASMSYRRQMAVQLLEETLSRAWQLAAMDA